MSQKFGFQWHITDNCDQRCKHCYIFSKEKNALISQNLDQMKLILENCLEFSQKFNLTPGFFITGGDPILNDNFWDLLELIHKNKKDIIIMGNPFHLNDDICKRLKELGCISYQLSIDGNRQTHDKVRREGSFDETLEKIECINNAGIESIIMTTVNNQNINEIPKIIDTVVKYKAQFYTFARYCDNGGNIELNITPQEYKNFLECVYLKFKEYENSNTIFTYKDHLWNLFLFEKGLYKIDDKTDKKRIYDGCHCAYNTIAILSNGDFYACRRFESKVGNAYTDRLKDIFFSNRMKEYRKYENFEKCSKCELLRFCRGCPAVAFGQSKSFYAKDPQCWKKI